MRKLFIAATAALLLAGLSASPALASHTPKTSGPHDTAPTPPAAPGGAKQVCSVQGDVTTEPGVSDEPAHNVYDFIGTSIHCPPRIEEANNQDLPNVLDAAYAGHYDVTAGGTTDGPDHPVYFSKTFEPHTDTTPDGGSDHGEDCAAGWGVDGDISVEEPTAGNAASGNVHFVRVGSQVTAWGDLNWTSGTLNDVNFLAELVFEPEPEEILACIPNPTDNSAQISDASLRGIAVIY